ncbi:hypothetical protein L1987_23005 [Smallanthus sonchifolius]|uniref:Uncharacterized protein n=1 Tax=Smallanthus sonchifolius TaxID=185202 RepID=A0ACB9IFP1_9ASTR|nr:hypothetical protein L1987_23005 [Smallanthus sonchifolius]
MRTLSLQPYSVLSFLKLLLRFFNSKHFTYCIMGGGLIDDDQDLASALTLVLVEETGNSILGTKSIESTQSSSGVTATTELKATELEDGRMLNVIDTPGMLDSSADPESVDQDLASALTLVLVGKTGMFDSSVDPECIQKEIVRCIHMSRDGIHAVLLVFSICSRFSDEEHAVICGLVGLFGNKIYDYMIIVFTSGDELEAHEKSLDDFLRGCSEPLKEILRLCGDRYVLFDNRTKDETKKSSQVQQLLSYVNNVLEKNDGKPYTSEIFAMFKEVTENQSINLTDRKLKPIIELKSKEYVNGLKGELAKANEDLKHWRCVIM